MAKIWTRQMTDNLLKDIENMDEEEAEHFFKALAEQSHDHEVKAFLDEYNERWSKDAEKQAEVS